MDKYDYTINPVADEEIYNATCQSIKASTFNIEKEMEVMDVDGSQVTIFTLNNGNEIDIYNDYDTDAVYVLSTVNLDELFPNKKTSK